MSVFRDAVEQIKSRGFINEDTSALLTPAQRAAAYDLAILEVA